MTTDAGDSHKMPLLDHLIELRQRLLWSVVALFVAFLVCFFFAEQIFRFLSLPLANVMMEMGIDEQRQRMIFTGLPEQFLTEIKIAFFAALAISTPILLLQIWKFVAPGLYKHEKARSRPF